MFGGKRLFFIVLQSFIAAITLPIGSNAEEISREMLLYDDIPLVSTSAKHPLKISDSPSTVYVITEKEIRSSGAVNIPDLLRMVPGIDVMATSASDFNVSARGSTQLLANKMLVLIDGRFVYQDLFGMVFWETLTVEINDIKQIEIVLGPGSTLYGANAFSGVINIITKDPNKDAGTDLSIRRGDPGITQDSITYRGKTGNFSYKISASENNLDKWDKTDVAAKNHKELDDSEEIYKFWGLLQYHPTVDSAFSISGGRSDGAMEFFPIEYLTVLPWKSEINWYRAMYKDPKLMVHYFENSGYQEIYGSDTDHFSYRTGEGEITYTLNAGDNNLLTVGGTYRENSIRFGGFGYANPYYIRPWGIYLQDELKLSNKITVVGGARYDYHTLTGYQTSPRGGIIYHVTEDSTLRLSAGKAYRNPSFLESYLDFVEVLAKDPSPAVHNITLNLKGRKDIEPEEIVSYELGFEQRTEGSGYGINLYYNDISNIIGHRYKDSADCNDGQMPINICLQKDFLNTYSAYSYGGDLFAENRLTNAISSRIGYGHHEMYNKDTDRRIESTPIHNLTGEVRYDSNGLVINLQGQYHGRTKWEIENFSIDPATLDVTSAYERFRVPAYTVFNLNISKRFENNMEISLTGSNIFNDGHREFPEISMPIDTGNPFGELSAVANSRPNTIGRRLSASLRIEF